MKKLLFVLLYSFPLFSAEILSLGDALMDHVVFVEENFVESIPGKKGGSSLVNLEEFKKLLCRRPIKRAGGSSGNSLKVLADLGHDCALIGKIGTDKEGDHFIKEIKKRGVISHLTRINAPTGRTACLITPDGQRTMRTFLGILSSTKEFTLEQAAFKGIKHFHFAAYQLRNIPLVKQAIAYAKEAKATISIDLASFEIVEDFKKELLEMLKSDIDIVFANEDEARTLLGLDPEKASLKLATLCDVAVVTTGAKGGHVATNKGKSFHFPAHCNCPIDGTGAGDHFLAGFLHGVLENKPIEICTQYGAAISGRIVRVVGADMPKKAWNNLSKSLATIEKSPVGDDHKVGKNLMTQNVANGI